MKIDEFFKNKFININMNDIQISNNDRPIIGTSGLASCIGFILYSKENKKAIVGHISCSQLMDNKNLERLRLQTLKIIIQNKLINSEFELFLIEGAQKSMYYKDWYELDILQNQEKKSYSLFEILEKNLTQIDLIKINNIKKTNYNTDEIQTVDINGNLCNGFNPESSKQFAFNANTGKFITNKIYILPEKEEIKKH